MDQRDFRNWHLEHIERERARINAQFDKKLEQINRDLDRKRQRAERALSGKHAEIISAAHKLLNEDGINELSLRKLAKMLNIKAPALYWYFRSKEDLIDQLAERILAQEFEDLEARSDDTDWKEWLMVLCKRLRKAMLSTRDGARIVAGAHLYPAVTLVKLLEVSQESLESAGIEEARADLIISTAVHFTFGRVIEEQAMPSEEQMNAINVDDFIMQFPHLRKSIERMQSADSIIDLGDKEFDDSLRLIIHE